MRRFIAFGPAFVVLVVVAVTLLAAPSILYRIRAAQTAATIDVAQRSLDQDDVLERLNNAIRHVAEAVEPSVVHIDVLGRASRGWLSGSSGSGWIYDDAGHVVTNEHVVSGGRDIKVQLHDGRVATAQLVGSDPFTDIAVLKISDSVGIFPIRRAGGHRPEQGDRVFAFGSPFGFKFSMSEGIVSGLGRSARSITGVTRTANYIQTDAAVNPGNSGGPLVDVRGRLIGMNVAIATAQETQGATEGQSSGISFAIPLTVVESRVEQIIATGSVQPSYIGVRFDDHLFEYVQTPVFTGRAVRIETVVTDGPAAKGGLKAGDLIVAFDGQPTPEREILAAMITSSRPGQTVNIRVLRDNVLQDFSVQLGVAPSDLKSEQVRSLLFSRCGINFIDAFRGVIVRGVRPGSAAADAGFLPGQLVVRVGTTEVNSFEALADALVEASFLSGREVTVTVTDAKDDKAPETELILKLSR
jgi:S1-C subfamily serine protease